MDKTQKKKTSIFGPRFKPGKKDPLYETKTESSKKKIAIGIIIGIFLSVVTIALQCVAFFTPHWKEISPNTHSLYIDGIDALIRTEVLHYFNTIHRYTRHSYGLFQRCEYLLENSTIYNNQKGLQDFFNDNQQKKCTKNYLPSYVDDHFNFCHSLPYYRFCAKASERNFNVNNDYLRATFDIQSSQDSASTYSCDCHYPPYVSICHIIGTIALIFLFLTSLLYSLFPFSSHPHRRLKIKCFAVLSSLLATIFLMIHLIIIYQNLGYESIEYLNDIHKHYRTTQIYKLSQDTKTAIDRFLSSINIRIGYSAILAWIAFILSIIDGIILLLTCKIKHDHEHNETNIDSLSSEKEDNHSPFVFGGIQNDSQTLLPPAIHITDEDNIDEDATYNFPRENERFRPTRFRQEDEV